MKHEREIMFQTIFYTVAVIGVIAGGVFGVHKLQTAEPTWKYVCVNGYSGDARGDNPGECFEYGWREVGPTIGETVLVTAAVGGFIGGWIGVLAASSADYIFGKVKENK